MDRGKRASRAARRPAPWRARLIATVAGGVAVSGCGVELGAPVAVSPPRVTAPASVVPASPTVVRVPSDAAVPTPRTTPTAVAAGTAAAAPAAAAASAPATIAVSVPAGPVRVAPIPRGAAPPRPTVPVAMPASPPPPAAASVPADHLVGPGVDVLVSPMPAYDCSGFSPPLPEDRVVIDPCAQRATGVPLIVGHDTTDLLWNATVGWGDATVVRYGGQSWRIVLARVVDHWITYYPMPLAGVGLQVRTCQPDGTHEWVWDLVEQP
jgi:hypothetical protein